MLLVLQRKAKQNRTFWQKNNIKLHYFRTQKFWTFYFACSIVGHFLSHFGQILDKNVGQLAETGVYPGFCSKKRLGIFLLSLEWNASPSQGYPSIKFAGTHLYSWVERGTVRDKCFAQEHNTMSPARARTRIEPLDLELSALTMRTSRLFSLAFKKQHRLQVFPRIILVSSFPELDTDYKFPRV